ncbi:MAG: universal stress protein [Gammaproteobacteria bacterium]|nr:universal stress protein [Gammaproteobacteria bacterium]
MSDYQKILVVVDPKMERDIALIRGIELAKRSGAKLHLLLVDYNSALFRARFIDPELLRQAIEGYLDVRRKWLDTELAKLQETGIEAEGRVVWHRPAHEEIAHVASELRPDLVIKAATPVRGLDRILGTPEDRHLVRLCPTPLMLVNPQSSTIPQKILAAVDPFDTHDKPHALNDEVLKAALRMAYAADARVDVAHAYEYLPAAAPVGAETVFADAGVFERVREEHREEFIRFGKSHSIPEDQMHLREGEPWQVISELADDMNIDLVVLGTVQRSGLKRVMMGATAESILSELRCDILVLKPEGFSDDLAEELKDLRDDRLLPEPWKEFRRFSL